MLRSISKIIAKPFSFHSCLRGNRSARAPASVQGRYNIDVHPAAAILKSQEFGIRGKSGQRASVDRANHKDGKSRRRATRDPWRRLATKGSRNLTAKVLRGQRTTRWTIAERYGCRGLAVFNRGSQRPPRWRRTQSPLRRRCPPRSHRSHWGGHESRSCNRAF